MFKPYDDSLRVQVNNARGPADFIVNMSDLRKDLDDVQTIFDAEVEASKPPPPPALPPAGSPPKEKAPSDEEKEVSRLENVVAKLFPKVHHGALKSFITVAERRVKMI